MITIACVGVFFILAYIIGYMNGKSDAELDKFAEQIFKERD